MTIETSIQALSETPWATAIREGSSLFPLIETGHVIAIAIVLGTISIIDLRLLGLPAHRRSADRLIRELLPYTWVAFAFAALFGSLLFASNAPTYYVNAAFRVKMAIMAVAGLNMGVFHLATQKTIAEWGEAAQPPLAARVAGLVSLGLWLTLIFYAREVGFTLTGRF